MSYELQSQFFDVSPPRRGQGFALATDNVARVYNIQGLEWGGENVGSGVAGARIWLNIHAEGTDIFFRFQSTNDADISTGGAITAGNPVVLQNTYGERLPANETVQVCIDKNIDKFLSVRSASAGTVRVSMSGPPATMI